MTEISQNTKFLLFGFGPDMHAKMALVVNFLGIVTTVLGIVSAIVNNPIGIGSISWFLLAIIFFIWGMSFWFAAYFGAKEGYTK